MFPNLVSLGKFGASMEKLLEHNSVEQTKMM